MTTAAGPVEAVIGGGGMRLDVSVLIAAGMGPEEAGTIGGGSGDETFAAAAVLDSRLLEPSLAGSFDLISFRIVRISIMDGRVSLSAATQATAKLASSLGHSGGNAEMNSGISKL